MGRHWERWLKFETMKDIPAPSRSDLFLSFTHLLIATPPFQIRSTAIYPTPLPISPPGRVLRQPSVSPVSPSRPPPTFSPRPVLSLLPQRALTPSFATPSHLHFPTPYVTLTQPTQIRNFLILRLCRQPPRQLCLFIPSATHSHTICPDIHRH